MPNTDLTPHIIHDNETTGISITHAVIANGHSPYDGAWWMNEVRTQVIPGDSHRLDQNENRLQAAQREDRYHLWRRQREAKFIELRDKIKRQLDPIQSGALAGCRKRRYYNSSILSDALNSVLRSEAYNRKIGRTTARIFATLTRSLDGEVTARRKHYAKHPALTDDQMFAVLYAANLHTNTTDQARKGYQPNPSTVAPRSVGHHDISSGGAQAQPRVAPRSVG